MSSPSGPPVNPFPPRDPEPVPAIIEEPKGDDGPMPDPQPKHDDEGQNEQE